MSQPAYVSQPTAYAYPAFTAPSPVPPVYGAYLTQAGYPPPLHGSPSFQNGPFQPPSVPTHSSNGQSRPGSVPGLPGLPARPAFSAPPVDPAQFQQMHQGQLPGVVAPLPGATSVDELIANAAKNATSVGKEKAAVGKEKEKKPVTLVYTDNEISPEAKKAQFPRYAYTPARAHT